MRPIKNVFVHVRRAWERTVNQGRWSDHEDEGLEKYVDLLTRIDRFDNNPPGPFENSVTRGMRYPNALGDPLPTAGIGTATISHIAASVGEVGLVLCMARHLFADIPK
jgi:hypothetical protein